MGTGPYMVDAYEGNSFLRLKANAAYWGGKPAFETVVFKFVTDATSRVAEIESGSSDITLEVPYEEFDRLVAKDGLDGVATPISDIGMIFLRNTEPMLDKNVRLAAHHAIDKQAIVDRLLRGYGVPIATLEAPEYDAFDPSIEVPHDPAKAAELLAQSGYGPDNPVRFTIQTTRGFKPKDFEMIQAIVGMWRRVGIEAEIEVYEIAKHFELRAGHALAPRRLLQLGQRHRRPDDLDGLRHVRPLAALLLEDRRRRRDDRPALGRGGRGEAHRGLEGRVGLRRRAGLRHPGAAIRPADRVQGHARGDAERVGRAAADAGRARGVSLGAILKRLGTAAVTLFGVAVVVFVLLRAAPGDPIAMMIGPGASEADIAALRARYGLDLGLLAQFWIWLQGLVVGDFGTSISLRSDVLGLVAQRLPATLELAGAALVVALVVGGAIAILGTLARRSAGEAAVDGANGLLLAVPDFIWALAFVLIFAVFIPVFPLTGRMDPTIDAGFVTRFFLLESLLRGQFAVFGNIVSHMTMPVLALALPLAAIVARVLKGALIEAMEQDYVLLARLKGKSELRLVLQESLRNALPATLALTGVQFTFLIGGTVIIERIFAYPGIGNMAIDAVINRDLPLIQGIVLAFGALFILVNLAVDLAVVALNPRLRHG